MSCVDSTWGMRLIRMLEPMFLRVQKISVTTWIASKLQLATVCVICVQQPFSVYFFAKALSESSVELEYFHLAISVFAVS